MRTLEQIKNEYAVSKGFDNWENLVYQLGYNRPSRLLDCIDRVIILAQKECLNTASDNLLIRTYSDGSVDYDEIKESITNENNIIK